MPRPKKANRADGRYEVKRTVGHDLNGKAIIKSFYGKSKDEALKNYQEYCAGIAAKKRELIETPFSSWVDKWLYTYKEPDVKETTFLTTYKRPCDKYIKPYFENRILQEIRQIDIKEFLNTLTDLSQSMLDKIVICLNGIFESAIDNDLINKNPCRNVNVRSKAEKKKKRTYDAESVAKLCASEHKYALYVQILLQMGLRCSELCGLTWEKIDLVSGTMTIDQALTADGSRIFIDKPKSINSTRKLNIPADLLEKLKAKQGTGFIAIENGKNLTPCHFSEKQLKVFYKAEGVPDEEQLSPHELRHTCGTLLYKQTKDIYHVSRFLGHSDIGITTKTYVHSEMQDKEIHIHFIGK